MMRLLCALLAALLLQAVVAISSPTAQADDAASPPSELPRLESGSGAVTYQTSSGDWKVLYPGERLPRRTSIKVSGSAPAIFAAKGFRAVLLPGSHGTLGPVVGEAAGQIDWSAGFAIEGHAYLENNTDGRAVIMRGNFLNPRSAIHFGLSKDPEGETHAALFVVRGHYVVHSAKGPVIKENGTLGEADQVAALKTSYELYQPHRVGKAQGLGQLVVDAQSESPVRLNLARYHVNVVLQPPVALVQIDQGFYNPYPRQEEGTFIFNLPPGASVSRFAMYVTPTSLIEGEVIERKRARQVYDTIVRSKRDPAILEEIGDNLFKMRVFPIFAQETKRVLLDYTVPLEEQNGRYRFRLPLMSDLKPIGDFRLTGTVRGHVDDSVVTDGIETPLTELEHSVDFRFARTEYQPPAEFSVEFREPPLSKPRLLKTSVAALDSRRLVTGINSLSERDTDVVLAKIPGLMAREPAGATRPVDVLLLADTSSNMGNLRTVRNTVQMVLKNLGQKDRVRLAAIDQGLRWLDGGKLLPADKVDQALRALDREFALGGSHLQETISEAVTEFSSGESDPSRRRLVIYVGDGYTRHMISANAFAQELGKQMTAAKLVFHPLLIRWDALGARRCEKLARVTGGCTFDITAGSSDERRLLAWILSGMPAPRLITEVEVAGARADDVFYPAACLPDEPLTVLARGKAQDKVSLVVKLAGERDQKFELTPEDGDPSFLARFWAKRKIDRLRRLEQGGGLPEDSENDLDAETLQRRIIELSQEWSLLTPLTAFLVLETEQDYLTWKIDRRQRRRYWKPAEAEVSIAVSRKWIDSISEPLQADPRIAEVNEVLRKVKALRQQGDLKAAEKLLVDQQRTSSLLSRDRRSIDPATKELKTEFDRLMRDIRSDIRREEDPLTYGPYTPLFDLTKLHARAGRFEIPSLAAGAFGGEFASVHPHAMQLLKLAPWGPREWKLDEFAKEVAKTTGIRVHIDKKSLDLAGFAPDHEFRVAYGSPKRSIRSYLRQAVKELKLEMIDEPHGLTITSPETAQFKIRTSFLPVADLLLDGQKLDLTRLSNPYLDYDETNKDRIRKKLTRPISVDFSDVALEEVIGRLADQLGEPFAIDRRALTEAGVPYDFRIKLSASDVPASVVLQMICEQAELQHDLQGDTIVVSTSDDLAARSQVRLHSLRGLVFEQAVDYNRYRQLGGNFGGFGGGGFAGAAGRGLARTAVGGGFGGGGAFGGGAVVGAGGREPGPTLGAPAASTGQVGISLTSAENVPGQSPVEPAAPPNSSGQAPVEIPGESDLFAPAQFSTPGKRYEVDSDSIVSALTSTVQPTGWSEVGGQSSLALFEPTLDLVLSAPASMQDEIETYFDRLRRITPNTSFLPGRRLAKPRSVRVEEASMYLDDLVGLLTATIEPTNWTSVGGLGTIVADADRMALILSSTSDVTSQVIELLTRLRRNRYLQQHNSRPWQPGSSIVWRDWEQGESVATSIPEKRSEPAAAELKALEGRTVLHGQLTYRRTVSTGSAEKISVTRSAVRLDAEIGDRQIRIEGNRASLGYPSLGLYELGPWGDAIQREIDLRLPWLPHRSNRELAELGEVIESPPGKPGLVRVRILAQGPARDTFFEIDFAAGSSLPTAGLVMRQGKVVASMSFGGAIETPAGLAWQVVSLTGHKETIRWELEDTSAPQATPDFAVWPGLVTVQKLDNHPVSAAAKACDAIRDLDFVKAASELRASLATNPKQPLLNWLLAVCHERDHTAVSADAARSALTTIATSDAGDLRRAITADNFPSIGADAVYEILDLQSTRRRSGEDWLHLTRAAIAAGRGEDAIETLRLGQRSETLRMTIDDYFLELRALLLAKEFDTAAQRGRWVYEKYASARDFDTIVDIFAEAGQNETAVQLLTRALALYRPQERKLELMKRRAELLRGLPRWQQLIEIYEALPAEDRDEFELILANEFTESTDATSLEKFLRGLKHKRLRQLLLIRLAELSKDRSVAAEAAWEAVELGADDVPRAWAVQKLLEGGYSAKAAQLIEAQLQNGETLSPRQRRQLVDVYELLGRTADAKRAETTD